jgi:hypothetical protein
VILAEAQRESQVLRGEGDGQAITIRGDAFGQDADFYSFYRSLEAYRTSIANQGTTMVVSPTGDFFRFFRDATGGRESLGIADLTQSLDDMAADADSDTDSGADSSGDTSDADASGDAASDGQTEPTTTE